MTLRQQSIDVDDLMSRSTFGNLLKGVKAAQRAMQRARKAAPAFLVVTEAGQTNVYDQQSAINLATLFAEQLGYKAIVLQLVTVVSKSAPKPAEPPEGRTA